MNLFKVSTSGGKSMQVQFDILINTQRCVLIKSRNGSYYNTGGNVQGIHAFTQLRFHKIISPQSNSQEDIFKHTRPDKDITPQQSLHLQHYRFSKNLLFSNTVY